MTNLALEGDKNGTPQKFFLRRGRGKSRFPSPVITGISQNHENVGIRKEAMNADKDDPDYAVRAESVAAERPWPGAMRRRTAEGRRRLKKRMAALAERSEVGGSSNTPLSSYGKGYGASPYSPSIKERGRRWMS